MKHRNQSRFKPTPFKLSPWKVEKSDEIVNQVKIKPNPFFKSLINSWRVAFSEEKIETVEKQNKAWANQI